MFLACTRTPYAVGARLRWGGVSQARRSGERASPRAAPTSHRPPLLSCPPGSQRLPRGMGLHPGKSAAEYPVPFHSTTANRGPSSSRGLTAPRRSCSVPGCWGCGCQPASAACLALRALTPPSPAPARPQRIQEGKKRRRRRKREGGERGKKKKEGSLLRPTLLPPPPGCWPGFCFPLAPRFPHVIGVLLHGALGGAAAPINTERAGSRGPGERGAAGRRAPPSHPRATPVHPGWPMAPMPRHPPA